VAEERNQAPGKNLAELPPRDQRQVGEALNQPPTPGREPSPTAVKAAAGKDEQESGRGVITVAKGWEYYRDYSKTASEITRNLGLAGLAVIWIFKTDDGGRQVVPPTFYRPALLLVVGLALDLFQYVLSAEIWRIHTRRNEKSGRFEFDRRPWMPWLQIVPYWLKIALVGAAYFYLIRFLARNVFA
jgi:hypothetical protein